MGGDGGGSALVMAAADTDTDADTDACTDTVIDTDTINISDHKELAPNKKYKHIDIYIFRFLESKSLSRFSRILTRFLTRVLKTSLLGCFAWIIFDNR